MSAGRGVGGSSQIGVLALQGAFREHRLVLRSLGVDARHVRWPADLAGLDGLILPGGESTAIANLLRLHGLYEPILAAAGRGLALFGTCAGAILLARRAEGARPDQRLLGLLDATVARNAYGRQVDSFEAVIPFRGVAGGQVHGIFIRAPRFIDLGPSVEVLSTNEVGEPLAVRQGRILALAFHPELTTDNRVHRYFLEDVVAP